jgi:RNA polymerase sigma-70 factor (ECF subfamily)
MSPRSTEGLDDEALLGRLGKSDQEALAVLFRRFARAVRSVGLRILRSEPEADDLVQDVFLFLFQKASAFDPARGSARTWILLIAYNRALDRRKYLNSRHFYTSQELEDDTVRASEESRDRHLNGSLLEEILGRDIAADLPRQLSTDQLETIRLHFSEGHSLKEIAEIMGQSLVNVRNTLLSWVGEDSKDHSPCDEAIKVRELGPHRTGGGANIRPFDPHQECQRLCALSLSGDLSAAEAQWLDDHLRVCTECKGVLDDYEQLVSSVMPELAAQDHENQSKEDSSTWSIEDAERRLFAALPTHSSPPAAATQFSRRPSLWTAIGRYGIAAALLAAVLALGYGLGHRSTQTVASQKLIGPAQPSNQSGVPSPAQANGSAASDRTEILDHELASLHEQIRSLNLNISKMQEQRTQQDERLAAQSQALEGSSRSQDELKERLAKAESDRQALTVQLASVEADRSKEIADASALRAQLKEANGALQSRDSDIAQDQDLLKHDRDIRNSDHRPRSLYN